MAVSVLLALATSIAALGEGSKGRLGLRVEGLRPVRMTASVQLHNLIPSGDHSAMLSGLSNADREKLRGRLAILVRAELERVGFEVVDPATEGVPLFVVYAESRMEESDRGPCIVDTSVEVEEPAVWVRDPTRKGFIVVWKHPSNVRVPRKDVATSIERSILEGVQAFTSAQAQPPGKED
jgi:hypothetical protein